MFDKIQQRPSIPESRGHLTPAVGDRWPKAAVVFIIFFYRNDNLFMRFKSCFDLCIDILTLL